MSALIVACPHCHRKNRLPKERLADGGTCGHCKQPLFVGQPVALTAASLNTHLHADLPVVADFWAPWCGPCRQFAPVFEKAATVLEPHVRLATINTEAEPMLAQRFAIRSIPTLILLRHGREVQRLAGALPEREFIAWVKASL